MSRKYDTVISSNYRLLFKAAQAALGLSVEQFAKNCGIGKVTLIRLYAGEKMRDATLIKIIDYLDGEGISLSKKGISHPTLFKEKAAK